MSQTPGPRLLDAFALAHELGNHVDRNSTPFNRWVLFIVFCVAVALSSGGFLFGTASSAGISGDEASWVYLSLAVLTALSLVAYERLPTFRSCALAVPITALGASFVLLEFRTRLGWLIVAGTIAAGTPLVALEVLRTCFGRKGTGDTDRTIARDGWEG